MPQPPGAVPQRWGEARENRFTPLPPMDPRPESTLLHDRRSLERAAEALRCLPLRRVFYETVSGQALSSLEVAQRNTDLQFCRRRLRAAQLEGLLIWLIRLGVLRREVDGQGLTERVRLTPMGRQVLERWSGEIPTAPAPTRLRHALRRHWPRL